MKKAFVPHCGGLPAHAEDGQPVVALVFDAAGPRNRFALLLADGADGGDAAALAAALNAAAGDADVAAAAHAHLEGSLERVEADFGVPGQHRRRCLAWVRRVARVIIFHARSSANGLFHSFPRSQALQVLNTFAPGTTDMVRVLASAGALLADLALPLPHGIVPTSEDAEDYGDGADLDGPLAAQDQEQQRRRLRQWAAWVILYVAAAAAAAYCYVAMFASVDSSVI